MITEKIYLDAMSDEYKEVVTELVNRLDWQSKNYNRMVEITLPERDTPIFDFIFGTI